MGKESGSRGKLRRLASDYERVCQRQKLKMVVGKNKGILCRHQMDMGSAKSFENARELSFISFGGR